MKVLPAGFAALLLVFPLVLVPSASAARAAKPTVTLTVSPNAFSPNADRIKDRVAIAVHAGQPSRIVLMFLRHGLPVFSSRPVVTVAETTVHFGWRGRTRLGRRGKPLPDGRYRIRAVATAEDGVDSEASSRVLLDTQPPVVRWRGLSRRRVDAGPLRLRGRIHDRSDHVRVGVLLTDQLGNPVPGGRLRREPALFSLRFPRSGRVRLEPGAYRISMRAVDELGNAGLSSARTFLVDRAVRSHVWGRFSRVGRRVALTFDDCNSPSAWSSILHTLRRYRVKAAFFCPGQQVRSSPRLARRTVAAGHVIGSHGWDHSNFAGLSYGSAGWRLRADRETWWRLARAAPTPYFRPPYGSYTSSTLAAAGSEGYAATVLWDVDPRDWTSPGTATIVQRVVGSTHAGSIVLMHVVPQTAAGLPTIIRELRARRLEPVSLAALARRGRASPAGWHS